MAAASAQADMTSIERVKPCCASTRPLDSSSTAILTRESSMNFINGSSIQDSTAVLMPPRSRCVPSCERLRGPHHLYPEEPDVRPGFRDGDQHEIVSPRRAHAALLRVQPQKRHDTTSGRTARKARLAVQRRGQRCHCFGVNADLHVRIDG